ncbi:four-jointed box protein 1 [Plakobranchus ocellatus]|uniref:Four-jointed box protein 1 n=1 Tax=Plakobranchus ocellatus TaxID=259542 RepID=A0AAV3ZTU5_9GAST|nr:four-jointed box protein 1 [Plakobranchus ocellatus]
MLKVKLHLLHLCHRTQARNLPLILCASLALLSVLWSIRLMTRSVVSYGLDTELTKAKIPALFTKDLAREPSVFDETVSSNVLSFRSILKAATIADEKVLVPHFIGKTRNVPLQLNREDQRKSMQSSNMTKISQQANIKHLLRMATSNEEVGFPVDSRGFPHTDATILSEQRANTEDHNVNDRVGFKHDRDDSGSMVVDGIYWSSTVEDNIPRGISDEEADRWLAKVHLANVQSIQPASWDRCGRPLNAFVTLRDGSHVCARYRAQRDRLVFGEVLSYWLSRYLGLDCVPPAVLARSGPLLHSSLDLQDLGWQPGRIVALIRWMDRINSRPDAKVLMPREILSAYGSGLPVSATVLSGDHARGRNHGGSQHTHWDNTTGETVLSDRSVPITTINDLNEDINYGSILKPNYMRNNSHIFAKNDTFSMKNSNYRVDNDAKSSRKSNDRNGKGDYDCKLGKHTVENFTSNLTQPQKNVSMVNQSSNSKHRINTGKQRSGRNDNARRETASMRMRSLAQLAQWGNMIIFDYLTGNYDRVASMQDGADRENDPNILKEPIRNLRPSDGGSKLWLIDNECGLLDAYTVLYIGQYANERFVGFHDKMLRTMCVFQRKVVRNLEHLHQQAVPHQALMRYASARDKLLQEMEPDESFDLFRNKFSERLANVVKWIRHCEVTAANR